MFEQTFTREQDRWIMILACQLLKQEVEMNCMQMVLKWCLELYENGLKLQKRDNMKKYTRAQMVYCDPINK